MVTFEAELGRLYWGFARDWVSQAKFMGYKVELWESSGWLSRQFIFRGDDNIIKSIAAAFNQLEDAGKAADGEPTRR